MAIQWCIRAMKGSGRIVVGDARIQGDLPKCMDAARLQCFLILCVQANAPVEWRDFRRTGFTKEHLIKSVFAMFHCGSI